MSSKLRNQVLANINYVKKRIGSISLKTRTEFFEMSSTVWRQNLKAKFISCYVAFSGCQVCLIYLLYTSNFVESF